MELTKEEPRTLHRPGPVEEILENEYTTKLEAETLRINKNSRVPILRGFRVRHQVFVHCPWCDRIHVHGWNEEDSARVVTFRVAHGGHEPPAPSSYRVSVFRQSDLKRVGYVCRIKGGMDNSE